MRSRKSRNSSGSERMLSSSAAVRCSAEVGSVEAASAAQQAMTRTGKTRQKALANARRSQATKERPITQQPSCLGPSITHDGQKLPQFARCRDKLNGHFLNDHFARVLAKKRSAAS